jgi:hypothetical protein
MLWLWLEPKPETANERVVVLDMSRITTVTPPVEEQPKETSDGTDREGGSEPQLAPMTRQTRELRGSSRNFLRREAEGRPEVLATVQMQPSGMFPGTTSGNIVAGRHSDNADLRRGREYSTSRGVPLGGGGNGDGPAIGGTDLGGARDGIGDGFGGGNGNGRGSRLGDGMGRGGPALGGGSLSAPSIGEGAGSPQLAVIKVPPVPAAVNLKYDRSPLIDWIEQNAKPIPTVLQMPENLDYKPGDAATWVEFTDSENNQYTLYLLGRRSQPPQLNIFLVSNGKGTLLQDEGAKGASEVFKYGKVTGGQSGMTVQMQQLPPGRQEARQMMAVFNAWWKQSERNRR